MNNDSISPSWDVRSLFRAPATSTNSWQNLAEGVESITRLSDQEILESGVRPAT